MSFFPAKDPVFGDAQSSDAIAQIIVPRSVDLSGLQVRRALPSARSRMVGPFIFFDHFGPAVFRAGDGIDDLQEFQPVGADGHRLLLVCDSCGVAENLSLGLLNWGAFRRARRLCGRRV